MKTRNNAAAAMIGLLSAITVFLCSCSEHAPANYINDPSVSSSQSEECPEIASTDSESAYISEPNVPAAQTPEKQPRFDDPDSYINYDSSTDTYYLTEEEEKIGEESLFVGDSICLGFSTWSVVSGKNVYATGNVGARNFFEYEMYYLNRPEKFVNVLNEVKPKHIFFWMGMNDVNLTSSEEYCENYREIIDAALKNSSADVYICAITPISRLEFTKLSYITEFNDAIGHFVRTNYNDRVHIINFGEPLKTADGLLDEQYNGGDGIHLSRKAYYVAMHEINRQMKKTQ